MSTDDRSHDGILIVGAGPAGVAIAYLLAARGLPVTLLDQEPEFDRVFRGEGLMPAGVQALRDMGLGDCLARIPTRPLDAWDFYVEGRRRMRVVEPGSPSGPPPTHIIHPSALLAEIAEQAQAYDTFQFYPGWRVRDLIRRDGQICGVQAERAGQTREFIGSLVMAADGRYSRLRKLAGLSLTKAATQFDVLWFKLPAPAAMLCETAFSVYLQRQRQFAVYPSWDERLQIGWIIEKGQAQQMGDRDWPEEFAQAAPPALADHFRRHRDDLVGPIFSGCDCRLCPPVVRTGAAAAGRCRPPHGPQPGSGHQHGLSRRDRDR